ncbi:MAG: hypothetical protein HQL13_04185, partial [Candidatus Omnitrophica bacterium]|nr:hypothetical protein [Candidatus Omnitrophota bacterium]
MQTKTPSSTQNNLAHFLGRAFKGVEKEFSYLSSFSKKSSSVITNKPVTKPVVSPSEGVPVLTAVVNQKPAQMPQAEKPVA